MPRANDFTVLNAANRRAFDNLTFDYTPPGGAEPAAEGLSGEWRATPTEAGEGERQVDTRAEQLGVDLGQDAMPDGVAFKIDGTVSISDGRVLKIADVDDNGEGHVRLTLYRF